MTHTARDVLNGTADWSVECGDSRHWVHSLPPNSVHCAITSPPYFSLRNYGTGRWEGGDPECSHKGDKRYYTEKTAGTSSAEAFSVAGEANAERLKEGRWREGGECHCGAVWVDEQIGLEETPDEYVANLVDVFRGLRKALHPSGVLWLNLGDSFNQGNKGAAGGDDPKNSARRFGVRPTEKGLSGLKPKDLIGIPWMVAFALRADGWYLRQWMPWVCRNKMPESADDRPSSVCEMVFLLTKSPDYFFDMEAVRRDSAPSSIDRAGLIKTPSPKEIQRGESGGQPGLSGAYGDGRNMRNGDLWFDSVGMLMAGHLDGTDDGTILGVDANTQPFKGAHFAVMPKKLILPLVLAGTSERGVCPHCSAPWVRVTEKDRIATRPGRDTKVPMSDKNTAREENGLQSRQSTLASIAGNRDPERHVTKTRTVGWEPTCDCADNDPVPAVVIDPFTGSGNVLCVARDRGRCACGNDLNEDYVKMARRRIGNVIPGIF